MSGHFSPMVKIVLFGSDIIIYLKTSTHNSKYTSFSFLSLFKLALVKFCNR